MLTLVYRPVHRPGSTPGFAGLGSRGGKARKLFSRFESSLRTHTCAGNRTRAARHRGGGPALGEIRFTDVEPVRFETVDGLELGAWFIPAPGQSPRLTVLVFNGNAGNRAHRTPLAAALHRHGLQVLLVDY